MISKNSLNKIIVIAGPTATGKTDLAIQVAKKFSSNHQPIEVINFDSLLFYRELNIGTAKPTAQERSFVPHHCLDIRSISSPMNASDFYRLALPLIHQFHKEGKIPLLVGGSGFYLQAILKGVYDAPTVEESLIQKSNSLYQREGITPFIEILKNKDPVSLNLYHQNDHYRIRRAVEHFWQSGTPFSEARKQKSEDEMNYPENKYNWDVYRLYLDIPRDEHFSIIRTRTKKMLNAGLISEVENLLSSGFTGKEKPLQSIGYKETQDYLKGLINSLEDLEERISISTRQLAKSQRTWFKKRMPRAINPLRVVEKKEVNKNINSFL